MDKKSNLLQRLIGGAEITGEPIPGVPLVELLGSRRVLIENHFGVQQYSTNEICVKVEFGYLCIRGNALTLSHMSKVQVVIAGEISSVHICRRRQ